jgi:Asp-tRNA(Asn)/Glu-tRNA(Gln) amidotransferase A subunit family amidase
MLAAIRGFDADDLSTADSLDHPVPAYTDLPPDSLRGARVGVLRDMFRKGPEVAAGNAVIDAQIDLLRSSGAIIVDGLSTGTDLLGLMPTLRVNSYELQASFDGYLRRRGTASPVKTFAELMATGKYLKGDTLETRFKETLQAGDLHTNAEYQARLRNQRMVRQLLVDVMDRYGVEALVYPMKPLGAPPVGAADDGPRDNNISAVTGLPAIVVPAGLSAEGLPLALELLGRPFSDATLLRLAQGYERVSHHRAAPKSTPHLAGDVIPQE